MVTSIDAIDVSNFTAIMSPQQGELLKAFGVRTVIVGASYGRIARQQLQASLENGLTTEVYAWITHPFSPIRIVNALNAIEGLDVKRIWLDAEDQSGDNQTPAQNLNDIRSAISLVRTVRPDLEIGIYTANWWWQPNTGNYKGEDICGLPLWFANYTNPDNVTDYKSLLFGGWKEAALWQYAGTIDTAGLNTDRNLILEETVANTYTKEEVDAKVGALLRLGVTQGAQISAIGGALWSHVANHGSTAVSGSEAEFKKIVDDLKAAQKALNDRIVAAGNILNG